MKTSKKENKRIEKLEAEVERISEMTFNYAKRIKEVEGGLPDIITDLIHAGEMEALSGIAWKRAKGSAEKYLAEIDANISEGGIR